MPHKNDLSINITDRKGKIITWTPSNPLPPESKFNAIVTAAPGAPKPLPKQKEFTVFRRMKSFFKSKVNPIQATRVVSTGHNYASTHTTKPPTIMRRFKNIWTHTSKSNEDLSCSTIQRQTAPSIRGRQASWTSTCGGCRINSTSKAQHDPALCHLQWQDGLDDRVPFSGPRRGAISHNLANGVSSQRFQTASEKTETLLSRSIARSPPMIPIFKDDIRACSGENQKDGNVGLSSDHFADIRTSSFGSDGSEVNVSIDSRYFRPFDFESRHNSDDMTAPDETGMFRFDDLEGEDIGPLILTAKPSISFAGFQKSDNSSRETSTITRLTLSNEPRPSLLGLPPSLRPLATSQHPKTDILTNMEEAMNFSLQNSASNRTPRPRATSSAYSSYNSSDAFIARQHDHPHEPADPVQAYLDREWPNPPYSPVHSQSPSTDLSLDTHNNPPSRTSSSRPTPQITPPNRSFSIERGHLEPLLQPSSSSSSSSQPIPISQRNPLRQNEEQEDPNVPISSFGSSFMEVPPNSPQLDTSQSSGGFEMVSSMEAVPAGLRRKRSSGPVMPGRYPSASSSMYEWK